MVVPLKDMKVITITIAFQKILDESNTKSSKVLLEKSNNVYNRSMKTWLKDKDIEIYWTGIYSIGKYVVDERFEKIYINIWF